MEIHVFGTLLLHLALQAVPDISLSPRSVTVAVMAATSWRAVAVPPEIFERHRKVHQGLLVHGVAVQGCAPADPRVVD